MGISFCNTERLIMIIIKEVNSMKASVDKDTCIGCGACPSICPEVFQMEDDGLATAYVNPVPSEVEATAQEAADACPVDAIHVG